MEMTLNNGFCELTADEVELIDGGGFKKAAQVFFGVVLVAWTPAAAIGASIVGTPASGAIVAGGTFGTGLTLIGAGTHRR